MSESPCFGTFIFYSDTGRFAVPPGAEKATRRVPPKPEHFKAKLPASCGAVIPVDAKDLDLRQILVLNTYLFSTFADWEAFRDSEIGTALWNACDNAVVYRVEETRGRSKMKGGVPPKPATERKVPPKPAKKTVKKTSSKTGSKPAGKAGSRKTTKTPVKKVFKSKGLKKSRKPMQPKARGGVPPKPTD